MCLITLYFTDVKKVIDHFRQFTWVSALVFAVYGSSLPFDLASAANTPPRPVQQYEDALSYFKNGAYSHAEIQLLNVLKVDPENLPARILLGEVYLDGGKAPAAIKELEKALALGGDENLILVPLGRAYLSVLKPELVLSQMVPRGHKPRVDGEIHLLQARAYMLTRRAKDAEEAYISAASMLPGDPRPLLGQAEILFSKRKLAAGIEILDRVLQQHPQHYKTWLLKAFVHRDSRQYEAATVAFAQALAIDPNSAAALAGRASMHMDRGHYDKADEDLARALEADPYHMEAVYLRALRFIQLGQPDEAKVLLSKVTTELRLIDEQYADKIPNARLMFGVSAFLNRDYQQAKTNLENFLAINPKHLGAKQYLASAYLASGDWDAVIRLLTPAPGEADIQLPMFTALLAEAHRSKGNHIQATKLYQRVLSVVPNQAGVGLRLAQSRFDAGKSQQAIADMEALVERLPDFPEAALALARMYIITGRQNDAIRTAKRIALRFPDNPAIMNFLGAVYLARNEFERADEQFKRVELQQPEAILPKLNRARVMTRRGEHASGAAHYRLVLEKDANNLVALRELAALELGQGQLDDAKELLGRLSELDAKNATLMGLKVRLALREQDTKAAEEAIYGLMQAHPDDPQALMLAARGFIALGKVKDAQAQLRRLVEKSGFDTTFLHEIAREQIRVGDQHSAVWSLTKGLQGNPTHLPSLVLQALTLLELKEYERAAEVLALLEKYHGDAAVTAMIRGDIAAAHSDLAAAVDAYEASYHIEKSALTLHRLVGVLMATGASERAVSMLRTWLAAHSEDIPSRHLLAGAVLHLGQHEEAHGLYAGMLKEGIDDPVVLNNLANVKLRLGRKQEARELAERVYEKFPQNPTAGDTLGWVLVEQGELEKGLQLLRDAFARDSDNREIRYHIAVALSRMNRAREARRELDAALHGEVNFPSAAAARTLLQQLSRVAARN